MTRSKRTIVVALAFALAFLLAPAGQPVAEQKFQSVKKREQDCRSLWSQLSADASLELDGRRFPRYLAAIKESRFTFEATRTGRISLTEFNNACTLGLFEGLSVPGRN